MKSELGKPTVWFSAGLYALAFFLTQVLHELGHAVAGALVGSEPVLHTAFVEHLQQVSAQGRLIHSAAGPVVSLVQGLLFLALLRLGSPPAVKLGLAWMSYHGLINVVGYLFSGAFAPGGDIGKVWMLLELPAAARWIISALSFASFFFLTRLYLPTFRELSPRPLLQEAQARQWARESGMFPGMLATPLLMLMSLPLPHWLSYLYVATACMPLFSFPDAFARQRLESPVTTWTAHGKAAAIALGSYALLHALGRLLLDGGVAL